MSWWRAVATVLRGGPRPDAPTEHVRPQPVRPEPRRSWADLPPVQRALAPIEPAVVNGFVEDLATSRDPRFLTPLGHAVDPQAPAGAVSGVVTASAPTVGEPAHRPVDTNPVDTNSAPHVQRAAAQDPPPAADAPSLAAAPGSSGASGLIDAIGTAGVASPDSAPDTVEAPSSVDPPETGAAPHADEPPAVEAALSPEVSADGPAEHAAGIWTVPGDDEHLLPDPGAAAAGGRASEAVASASQDRATLGAGGPALQRAAEEGGSPPLPPRPAAEATSGPPVPRAAVPPTRSSTIAPAVTSSAAPVGLQRSAAAPAASDRPGPRFQVGEPVSLPVSSAAGTAPEPPVSTARESAVSSLPTVSRELVGGAAITVPPGGAAAEASPAAGGPPARASSVPPTSAASSSPQAAADAAGGSPSGLEQVSDVVPSAPVVLRDAVGAAAPAHAPTLGQTPLLGATDPPSAQPEAETSRDTSPVDTSPVDRAPAVQRHVADHRLQLPVPTPAAVPPAPPAGRDLTAPSAPRAADLAPLGLRPLQRSTAGAPTAVPAPVVEPSGRVPDRTAVVAAPVPSVQRLSAPLTTGQPTGGGAPVAYASPAAALLPALERPATGHGLRPPPTATDEPAAPVDAQRATDGAAAQSGSPVPAPAVQRSRAPSQTAPHTAVSLASMFDPATVALATGLAHQEADGSVSFGAPPTAAPVAAHPGPSVQRRSERTDTPPAAAELPPVPTTGAVQRAEDPIATLVAAPAPAAAGAGAPLPTDLDELARRLYDRLSFRIREELWMDRERAGLLTDMGR